MGRAAVAGYHPIPAVNVGGSIGRGQFGWPTPDLAGLTTTAGGNCGRVAAHHTPSGKRRYATEQIRRLSNCGSADTAPST
ncbi:MAG: hypothetical protein EA381_03945 [Planctomycetaceae bacterium]|nr:MAG: hypothetical protein EA381_03945 [Planctomycetaceae bacterium]